MTVNAVASVSLDPMLVLVCPGKKTKLAQRWQTLSGFTINILREDQQALSTYFAGAWREAVPPPFRFVPSGKAMRLEGCLAAIDCESDQIIDAGDHLVVIGRVLDLHVGIAPHRPLLFFRGRYHQLDIAQAVPAPDLMRSDEEPPHVFYER